MTTRPDPRKVRRRQADRQPQQRPAAEAPGGQEGSSGTGLLTFLLASASGLLVWAALPPLSWWPLGWIAPIPWLVLIQWKKLPGRHPYWMIYLASALYWMLVMQGIRLAHWANYLGLVALGFYVGIYLPIFISVARVAHQRWRVPIIIAAPMAWVGVEVARGYGPLAFSMALLGHTQVEQLPLIQIADLFGPYTVSFAVMFVAACIVRALPATGRAWDWWPLVPAAGLVLLVLSYGQYRLGQTPPGADVKPLRVAIIQGSIDTVFDGDPERERVTLEQYSELTTEAVGRDDYQPLDLVMWPETMFPVHEILIDEGRPPRLEPWLDRQRIQDTQDAFRLLVANGVQRINEPDGPDHRHATHWVFGAPALQLGDYPVRRYNAALWVRPQGEIAGRYYKMRPVIFGEYVPFGDVIPALYNLFPLHNGLTPGTEPESWEIGGLSLSPSICFESTMPNLLRWHVVQLARRGRNPDVLINLTNDGWFWGSSILDMQLNCAIFRSVELRRPFLIAANTGFSAWIDGNGSVLAQGPRRDAGTLLAEVVPDGRLSIYEVWGDWPALCCTAFCLAAAIAGLWLRGRPTAESSDNEGTAR